MEDEAVQGGCCVAAEGEGAEGVAASQGVQGGQEGGGPGEHTGGVAQGAGGRHHQWSVSQCLHPVWAGSELLLSKLGLMTPVLLWAQQPGLPVLAFLTLPFSAPALIIISRGYGHLNSLLKHFQQEILNFFFNPNQSWSVSHQRPDSGFRVTLL